MYELASAPEISGYYDKAMNQMQWSQDKTLRNWMRETRLDGFGKLMSNIDPSDTEKMANMPKLMSRRMDVK